MSKKKIKNRIKEIRRRYLRRKHRVNTILKKVSDLPRLIVFRSNKYTYAQVIDKNWNVLASANDMKLSGGTKTERAFQVGQQIAKKLLEKWIEKVAFDRNGYKYIWRVKAVADWAREQWLKF